MAPFFASNQFNSMIIEMENAIQTLNYNLKTISIRDVLKRMGFPDNWKNLKNIERSVIEDED